LGPHGPGQVANIADSKSWTGGRELPKNGTEFQRQQQLTARAQQQASNKADGPVPGDADESIPGWDTVE
jgi:hypothetical protein